MRNELVVVAAILFAALIGLLLFYKVKDQHSPLDRSTTDLDGASSLMRADFAQAAGSVKVAVAEYYASLGKMPQSNAEAGLPAPDEYRGQTLKSVSVAADGIDFVFDANSGHDDGRIRLVADLSHANAMGVQWRCETSDYPQIARAISACIYTSPSIAQ
jgi:hypothetical protein